MFKYIYPHVVMLMLKLIEFSKKIAKSNINIDTEYNIQITDNKQNELWNSHTFLLFFTMLILEILEVNMFCCYLEGISLKVTFWLWKRNFLPTTDPLAHIRLTRRQKNIALAFRLFDLRNVIWMSHGCISIWCPSTR